MLRDLDPFDSMRPSCRVLHVDDGALSSLPRYARWHSRQQPDNRATTPATPSPAPARSSRPERQKPRPDESETWPVYDVCVFESATVADTESDPASTNCRSSVTVKSPIFLRAVVM